MLSLLLNYIKLKYGTGYVFSCVKLPATDSCTIQYIENDQPEVKHFLFYFFFKLEWLPECVEWLTSCILRNFLLPGYISAKLQLYIIAKWNEWKLYSYYVCFIVILNSVSKRHSISGCKHYQKCLMQNVYLKCCY